MTETGPVFFDSPARFRRWLEKNHRSVAELRVGFHRKATGRPSMTWDESVDEALCLGWIDGVRRSVDGDRYEIRFTPRRPGSIWSTKNIARAQELIAEGRMRPAGLAAFEARREDLTRRYSFEQGTVELGAQYERALRANAGAWTYFQSQSPSYRRTVTWWVISAKREETRRRRLEQLIACCAQGERIPGMQK